MPGELVLVPEKKGDGKGKGKPPTPHAHIVPGGLEKLPLPPTGFVRFRATGHAKLGLIAELGDGDVTPTGYGEFVVTDRVGQVGILGYAGRKPLALRIPLLFDRWSDRASVEPQIRMLERLHGLDGDLEQPPPIIIEGLGIPHSYSRAPQNRFVFTGDPEWGDDVRYRTSDGHRMYQEVTVMAQLLVRPMTLGQATTEVVDGARHSYSVPKSGGSRTLRGIAKKFGTTWQKLRKLNPRLHGDPDKALPAGTKVRYS